MTTPLAGSSRQLPKARTKTDPITWTPTAGIAFVAGPYVKQRAVVSNAYTTVNMISTIVDILGIEHLGTFDALQGPMTAVFSPATTKWDFNTIGPDILRTSTQLPLPPATAKNTLKKSALWAFYAKPRHDAGNWAAKTQAFDFSREDRVDAAKYNLIQWQGLMGENMPYPAACDGRDLRKNRKALLKKWRESRMASFTQHQAAEQTGGRQVGSARRLRNTGSLHDQKRRRPYALACKWAGRASRRWSSAWLGIWLDRTDWLGERRGLHGNSLLSRLNGLEFSTRRMCRGMDGPSPIRSSEECVRSPAGSLRPLQACLHHD